jgi:hypothetical protein
MNMLKVFSLPMGYWVQFTCYLTSHVHSTRHLTYQSVLHGARVTPCNYQRGYIFPSRNTFLLLANLFQVLPWLSPGKAEIELSNLNR